MASRERLRTQTVFNEVIRIALCLLFLTSVLLSAKSDAQEFGPSLVRDITPGTNDTSFNRFIAVNNQLFFVTQDESFNSVLWTSDGTQVGTSILKGFEFVNQPVKIGNEIYFIAQDFDDERALWRSNGTVGGTVKIVNAPDSVSRITDVNGVAFFSAQDPTNGRELWKSDGTAVGTSIVKNIGPGSLSSGPQELFNANGTLYFAATDQATGFELYKSDGTEEGTVRVADIRPGTNVGSFPRTFMLINGTVYFYASGGGSNFGLWTTDGTEMGTVLVKSEIVIGDVPVTDGTTAYFRASSDGFGSELWKSDGSEMGTVMIRDIVVGSDESLPSRFMQFNGEVFFTIGSGGFGNALLYKTDGTANGTVLVEDPNPNSVGDNVTLLGQFQNRLIYSARNPNNVFSLWSTDGIPGNGQQIAQSVGGPFSPGFSAQVGSQFLLTGSNSAVGSELFELAPLVQVSASSDENGSVNPVMRGVLPGGRAQFDVWANEGFATDELVGGTCPLGFFDDNVYITGIITAACNVSFTHSPQTFVVTATVDENGSLNTMSQTINFGDPASFEVTPNNGYLTDLPAGGTCDEGVLADGVYTIDEITEDCTVSFAHTLQSFAISLTVGENGAVSPDKPSEVLFGGTAQFTVTPNEGFSASIMGTCGGVLVDNLFTTNAIEEDCTLDIDFSLNVYSFTTEIDSSLGAIDPESQMVEHGSTASFNISAFADEQIRSVTGCGGVWTGSNPYVTASATQACTVRVSFVSESESDCDFIVIPVVAGGAVVVCL